MSDGRRWPGTAVHVVVNGRDLREIVTEFAVAHGYGDPGIDCLPIQGLEHAEGRLRGTLADWPGDGCVVLLVCAACGEEACGPILGRIRLGGDQVDWCDLHNPNRPQDDYADLRFTFDRAQYDAELRRAFHPGPRAIWQGLGRSSQ